LNYEREISKEINNIINNINYTEDEIYHKLSQSYPHYLINPELRKIVFEKVEGIYHDGIGTYFEELIFNEIASKIGQEKTNLDTSEFKIKRAIKLFTLLELESYHNNVDYKNELSNIINASKKIWEVIPHFSEIDYIEHTPQDFRRGLARDLKIVLYNGEKINLSLKTDKSGRVALAEIGQTPRVENLFSILFNLSYDSYNRLLNELFGTQDFNIIRKDFQNICLLTQTVLIKQLGLVNARINNFSKAKITNLDNLIHLIHNLKKFKDGRDNCIVIIADRKSGELVSETILDEISLKNIELRDFKTTPCIPKASSKYKYSTTYGIKYKVKTFVTFQVKHKRGSYASLEFGDITTRLETSSKSSDRFIDSF